ncbi:MAG: DUF559 domain-containing protein [Bacteroidota bacterium]
MKINHHYNPRLKEFSRELRNESVSRAEKYLWKVLKGKRLGISFKRQRPIGNYIVDFFAHEIGLIIEIDGNSHLDKGEYDFFRQQSLEDFGYKILPLSEGDVMQDVGRVGEKISYAIYCLKSPP